VGKRVRHSVFGSGTIIGVPKDRDGYIIQFDTVPTPRTLGISAKLDFI
jgi:DNA helicase-2/ATP-dependent DNA helicase PcrA